MQIDFSPSEREFYTKLEAKYRKKFQVYRNWKMYHICGMKIYGVDTLYFYIKCTGFARQEVVNMGKFPLKRELSDSISDTSLFSEMGQ